MGLLSKLVTSQGKGEEGGGGRKGGGEGRGGGRGGGGGGMGERQTQYTASRKRKDAVDKCPFLRTWSLRLTLSLLPTCVLRMRTDQSLGG